MSTLQLRHYGTFQNEEVIILGYRKSQNSLLICRVNALPSSDQTELRRIASRKTAQETADYLTEILQKQQHHSGSDWFSYLAPLLRRNVLQIISIKDISGMNDEQKSFFKGYGTSVRNLIQDGVPTTDAAHTKTPSAAPTTTDPALMAVLQMLAEGQKKIAETLDSMSGVKRPVPVRVRPSRGKPVTKAVETPSA